ncbi:hypothetical protein ACNO8S_05610 [Haloarcula sp. KBTZ06]|uniref:hypothetical protein n=1 Tax=Haloarcula sp. KBTZ06 TaxID=3402682 RepID=UPI003B42FA2C
MSFSDWFFDTVDRLQSDPSPKNLEIALRKLWAGLLGRFAPKQQEGQVVWDEDWDILVILDGCRADAMEEIIQGTSYQSLFADSKLETRWSVGGTSSEWIKKTFNERHSAEIQETAYITGNPYTDQIQYDEFSEFTHFGIASTEYDIRTVSPRKLTDHAINTWRKRDEKGVDRMIVHYMQPHAPFRSRPEWFREFKGTKKFGSKVWWRLCDGTVSHDDFWTAYIDNLEWILEEVSILSTSIDGSIALTADHGNAKGEWGVYGHPKGVPVSAVREVPWITLDGIDTEEYTPEYNVSDSGGDDQKPARESQLEALGYK